MTLNFARNHLFLLLIAIILLSQCVKGQLNKVSPKLDFDDTDDKSNSSLTGLPESASGRGRDNLNTDDEFGNTTVNVSNRDRDRNTNRVDGKSGPKIHGVRVTVDTGNTQKSPESKESVEITEGGAAGKSKKRVGIHTDITFEISADEDANATSSDQRNDKEDASVPIFKGRVGSSSTKPRKTYDSKSYWSPNSSFEKRIYETNYRRREDDSAYDDYYPHYPYNVPAYMSGSASSLGRGTVNRRNDGWTSYTPQTYWTTERPYTQNYEPNVLTAYRAPTFKPCYCLTTHTDSRSRRTRNLRKEQLLLNTLKAVNGKLESPFSKK